MTSISNAKLKLLFQLGALIDAAIAISWFMIAAGFDLPNILNGYVGTGESYRLAMFIAAMFMTAWTVILIWGSLKADERKGLLLITAFFLFTSVIVEWIFFSDILGGLGFTIGNSKRIIIATLMAIFYFKSEELSA